MHTRTTSRLAIAAILLALCPLAAVAGGATPAINGRWDATVVVNGVEIPFRFDVETKSGVTSGSFFNGDRRITSTASQPRDGGIVLTFAQYGATLDLSVEPGRLSGEYRRGARTKYPFAATRAPKVEAAAAEGPPIGGTWIVKAKSSKGETAWRFIAREDARTSDGHHPSRGRRYRHTDGSFHDGRYVLSHFSGARPLLLEVIPQADGSLTLRQNRKTELTAVREGDARGRDRRADGSRRSYHRRRSIRRRSVQLSRSRRPPRLEHRSRSSTARSCS